MYIHVRSTSHVGMRLGNQYSLSKSSVDMVHVCSTNLVRMRLRKSQIKWQKWHCKKFNDRQYLEPKLCHNSAWKSLQLFDGHDVNTYVHVCLINLRLGNRYRGWSLSRSSMVYIYMYLIAVDFLCCQTDKGKLWPVKIFGWLREHVATGTYVVSLLWKPIYIISY